MKKTMMAAAAIVVLAGGMAQAQTMNPLDYPQPEDGSAVWAFIEIPAGSITKYETDAKTGLIVVDRYMAMPVVYPANYGSITQSKNVDGDPLDILVLSREPIVPGALIKTRVIGTLKMIDDGAQDDKIVAVPASDVDPTYDGIQSIADLPAADAQRLKAFFQVYKIKPDGSNKMVVQDFGDIAAAQAMLDESLKMAKTSN